MIQKRIYAQYRRPTGLLGRWIGQRMSRQHLPENEWTVQLLDAQPDDHILEIGFGPGLAIEQLSKHITTGRITGIDFSQTMVVAAGRRNKKALRAGKVDLRYGDVQQLPFADAIFDRVFSIHSLYFWPNPVQACQEIYRVMKSGGTVIFTLLPSEQPESGTDTFKPYTGHELEMLLSQVGFIQARSVADELKRSPSNFSVVARK